MTDRSIASRPSLEQVMAIVDFMEKHPTLGLGQLRGLEGREESKKLWFKLTRIVNSISGPTRPMKSWIKYWADKKSTVRSKIVCNGVDPKTLSSSMEKKIWDLFLSNDSKRVPVKQETHYIEENYFNEESIDCNQTDDPEVTFEEDSPADANDVNTIVQDRQTVIMEKLVKVMSDQAEAISQLAHSSAVNAQAMERLAEASQIQARAIERLASTFSGIGAATHDVSNALIDIDGSMKRLYNTSPT